MKALTHKHTHTNNTNTLRDRLEWYSYNQNYIVNKSLQLLLNIHSVVRANFHYRLAAEGEKATQTLCFLVACVEMSEINRTAPAGNDSFDFRRRLKVRRDLASDYSWCHAAAGSLFSFFWTWALQRHTEMPGGWSVKFHANFQTSNNHKRDL